MYLSYVGFGEYTHGEELVQLRLVGYLMAWGLNVSEKNHMRHRGTIRQGTLECSYASEGGLHRWTMKDTMWRKPRARVYLRDEKPNERQPHGKGVAKVKHFVS